MHERYETYITPSARKEANKLPKSVRDAALDACLTLEQHPYAGERLTGSLHMLYSFHFSSDESEYRIAYSVEHLYTRVLVHLIHRHETLYKKLKHLFH